MENEKLILKASDKDIIIEIKTENGNFYSFVRDSTIWHLLNLYPSPETIRSEPYNSIKALLDATLPKIPLYKLEPQYIDPEYSDSIYSGFLWYIINQTGINNT